MDSVIHKLLECLQRPPIFVPWVMWLKFYRLNTQPVSIFRFCLKNFTSWDFLVCYSYVGIKRRERKTSFLRSSSLGEAHGDCVLQCFSAKWGDAGPSPDVTVRRTTELGRAGHISRTGEGGGHHTRKCGLIEVWLQPGAIRWHVGQAHRVGRGTSSKAALG